MSPIVDASVATALIAPDPLSLSASVDTENGKEETATAGSTDSSKTDNNNKNSSSSNTENEKKPSAKKAVVTADERFYAADSAKLEQLRSEKPWAPAGASGQQQQQGGQQQGGGSSSSTGSVPKRPLAKYFESISLSPSAVTKMMMHCQSGVEKGIAQGGNPIEVMGLMLGRPDPHKPTNLIVTDAFPLPIEGFETRVIADDQGVVNHMISLGECLERTRKEKFMGWYHSHPFDLVLGEDSRSHCFLSQTDLSTQLQWQRAEDPHGNPFCAVVVDPLRSMHMGTPQLKAFRAYPPEYQSAVSNECPDGSIVKSEKIRLERWGSCWNRYYELGIEYYMSAASRSILGDLTQNYLWMKSFRRESAEEGAASAAAGGEGGAGGSQAAKVAALKEIAKDASSVVGSSSSSGQIGDIGDLGMSASGRGGTIKSSTGGGPAFVPIAGGSFVVPVAEASTIEPLVRKLRSKATQAMTQQTARSVHSRVFAKLNLSSGVAADTDAAGEESNE
mmetsp:Transcript_2339/g.5022  ORF Transcript_2339/g.5022 Transcript_2339/m.5022 type:complete len:504 (+) Transcript_2339:218-1729(+)|eukprot:CAMPEP_0168176460 /NCGR_PEP_ID=MMETSP0139_2-20121125/7802_1 /TAXON_ID=44445 /ORGANISM="Pseudo-nitzschia australis, Strain 10249 10 AB" /LENGTH=503 /DNA_ID=CAMNT_0008095185 /DNA_START=207 /DNA_END=1718 /DNA_ORIENTATION=+